MQIIPEIPGWNLPPDPPIMLPGEEPFVLFAVDSMIARLGMDRQAVQRIINYLVAKYSVDEIVSAGWGNYNAVNSVVGGIASGQNAVGAPSF